MKSDPQLPEDRLWRLSNLYTIVNDQARLVSFQPNGPQLQFYHSRHYCNHILKARKLGFSTFIALSNLDDLLHQDNLVAGIVDKGMDDAKKKLQIMRTAWLHLDNPDLHPETWEMGQEIKSNLRLVRDAREELAWSNGSRVYCGTSLRGGTTNRLHISELGSTAIRQPSKAREIVEGALNSFTPGNRADIESTHEGGRSGLHYDLLRRAMASDPEKLTPLDFRFHFFPWFDDLRYVLEDPLEVREDTQEYFARLAVETGREFSAAQMLWYEKKADTQGFGMKKEFPSTPAEAFEAIVDGAIYGRELANLRAAGRVRELVPEADCPLYTFWDLGLSDCGAVWLVQPAGRDILVLDWHETDGRPASHFADQMRRWEASWGRPIARHFLPHDAGTRDRGTGRSYVDCLRDCGLSQVTVVPRTPDLWLGIGYVRDILPHCWFHAGNCDSPRTRDGTRPIPGSQQAEFPSGLACLEGYSRDVTGRHLREMPRHDRFSHTSDAFRTFAEAWRLGMVRQQELARPRALR